MRYARVLVTLVVVGAACGGCAPAKHQIGARPFDFTTDTLSYANELVWEYDFDANGTWTATRCDPAPAYSLHCFVVAR